jgi:CRP-like cAMP-binding protein
MADQQPPVLQFRPGAGAGVQVDLAQLVASRLLIQANSGGGKSRLLRYLCEQLHGRIQIILLDPEGEFASLREKFDFLLAGREGDVPGEPKTAKLLARRLLELSASAIIDLYDLQLHDRRKYVRLFLEELMHLPRKLWRPLLVIIDEAHAFAPERGQGEAESTQAVITLCTQGRKRGFCPVLATQRISKLHKDAAAELLNKLIGRTGLDVDMKRAGDELGMDKDARLTLRDLEPGTFYAFGPALSRGVQLVRGGDVTTTHPKPGEIAPPAPPPPAAVKKLLTQMQGLEREAEEEARTIADLERQLATARAEIRKLQRGVPTSVAAANTQATLARAVDAAERRLQAKQEQLIAEAVREHRAVERQLRGQLTDVGKRLNRIGTLAGQIVEIATVDLDEIAAAAPAKPNGATRSAPAPAPRKPAARPAAPVSTGATLPPGEHAVLTAACQYPDGVTREQLGILTGYKRSSRNTYIQRLRAAGLVDVIGDRIVAAAGAEQHLGDFEPLPTGSALREYWLERLPPGERAIFEALVTGYPESLDREKLSEITEYTRSSRNTYLQRLRARELVEIDAGSVRAAAFLFQER